MCSTPKRTGIMFRAARIEEDSTACTDYTAMLRRASRRMDRVQSEREAQQVREQGVQPGALPESGSAPVQSKPRPPFLSRLWDYLNTPHYLFR